MLHQTILNTPISFPVRRTFGVMDPSGFSRRTGDLTKDEKPEELALKPPKGSAPDVKCAPKRRLIAFNRPT